MSRNPATTSAMVTEHLPEAQLPGIKQCRVIYVSRNDGTDMRVTKECNSLLRVGYDVHFVGWDYPTDEDRPDPIPGVKKHLYSSNRNGSALTKILGFPRFAVHFAKIVHKVRPDYVHGVNEEIGLLAIALQRIYGYKSICDIFDSIELVWGQKGFPIRHFARGVARLVHQHSDALLVTDNARKMRLGAYMEKARTVSNYPIDVGGDVAFKMPNSGRAVRLYVAGTLSAVRGLDSVLRLLESRDDVEVISAGWIYDDIGRRFAEHPGVDYRGIVTPSDSLRLAAECNAILALYEPSNENNILASPNKIYDALCVGRPVVINREARVSQWIQEEGVGYVVPYGDVAALDAVIDSLQNERGRMAEVATALRDLFKRGYSWDVAEEELLAAYAQFDGCG